MKSDAQYEMERERIIFKALNRKETFWQKYSGDIGIILWIVACFLIGAGCWLIFDGLERYFR